MAIPFHCPCGYEGQEDDALHGKLSACPRCGELQRVGGEQRKGVRRERPAEPRPPAWADRPAPKSPYAPPREAHSPYAPPKTNWREPDYGREGPPRDLEHEAHVRAIAVWLRITAGLCLVAGVLALIVIPLGFSGGGGSGATGLFAGMAVVFVVVFVAIGALSYFIAQGLWNYANWARWVYGAFTALGMLGNVFGVLSDPSSILSAGISFVWSGAILWALFGDRGAQLFTPEYQDSLHNSRMTVSWASSPFFWLPFVFCLIGMCIVGAAGGAAGLAR